MKSDEPAYQAGSGPAREWVIEALHRYECPLLRYALRLTGDLDRARDIVQDTFLTLCETDRASVNGHLAPWLYTVCRNKAADIGRKERRMNPLNEVELASRPSGDPSPAAVLERAETSGTVAQMMEGLPPNQQEVIRLKFQEGLSYREISEVTGHSVTNVGYLLHTGLSALRRQMPRLDANAGRSLS